MPGLFKRVIRSARVILDNEPVGRRMDARSDDVFIVSYPKSGNTWLRFLIGNLAFPQQPVTFANVETLVPSIYVNNHRQLDELPPPRIVKSHEIFTPWYGRVIYAARDPRDVCVSYYHYQIKYRELPEGYPLDEFLPQFVRGEIDWQYGAWGDHVMSWLAMRGDSSNFMLLRYEDLLMNTRYELARVARFLRIPASPQRLERAIELSSAPRMRQLEHAQSHLWVSTRKSRQDLPFVRSARSGEWKETLSPRWIYQIEAAWAEPMHALGYELLSKATAPVAGAKSEFSSGAGASSNGEVFPHIAARAGR